MITVFKPIEITSTTPSINLSADQEAELFDTYSKTPDKLKMRFILNNLNKLDYLSKIIDINFLLPKYLADDFLVNNINQTVLNNLIYNNKRKLINITNFVNLDYNFCPNIIFKRALEFNKTKLSSEFIFMMANNQIYKELKNNKKLIYPKPKLNKFFFMDDNKQIFISFYNYQKLCVDTKYIDIKNYDNKGEKSCYICRKPYNTSLFFAGKQEMCYSCGIKNYQIIKTKANMTDQIIYVSGCRHTVGYQIALNILRNGGSVIGSSRYPNCALMNYQKESDWDEFKDRLKIIFCDFKNIASVDNLMLNLKNLNINGFINNAFQTVRTSNEYNDKVLKLENKLGSSKNLNNSSNTDASSNSNIEIDKFLSDNEIRFDSNNNIKTVLDMKTQWTQTLSQMDANEIMENNMINQIVPTLLFKKILEYFTSCYNPNKKYWLINVNSTEAFHQTPTHIVTGMNKIAMDNLIDRIRIGLPDNIICYNADPGFVTGVLNSNDKPLDSLDGAIRVLYPMMQVLNNKLNITNSKFESINFKHFVNQPRINYSTSTSTLNKFSEIEV